MGKVVSFDWGIVVQFNFVVRRDWLIWADGIKAKGIPGPRFGMAGDWLSEHPKSILRSSRPLRLRGNRGVPVLPPL